MVGFPTTTLDGLRTDTFFVGRTLPLGFSKVDPLDFDPAAATETLPPEEEVDFLAVDFLPAGCCLSLSLSQFGVEEEEEEGVTTTVAAEIGSESIF